MNRMGCLVLEGYTSHVSSNNFEVLYNVDHAARLEWVNWKQFSKMPKGKSNPTWIISNRKLLEKKLPDSSKSRLDSVYI
jgi:hypothetical protein